MRQFKFKRALIAGLIFIVIGVLGALYSLSKVPSEDMWGLFARLMFHPVGILSLLFIGGGLGFILGGAIKKFQEWLGIN